MRFARTRALCHAPGVKLLVLFVMNDQVMSSTAWIALDIKRYVVRHVAESVTCVNSFNSYEIKRPLLAALFPLHSCL